VIEGGESVDNKEFLLAQGFQKLDVDIAVGGYEEVPQLDPDLMFIKFILCHEGVNANGDTFTKDVLKQAQYTPKYKPVDWEHGQPYIGHILESEYKEDAQGTAYIEATGLVWKFIYPELSAQIKAKASTGELRLSMECYYREANYKIGDQIIDQQQAETLGIIPYVGRDYMGKKVARVFKEVIFGGVGVVANPADKKAVFLAVAKDLGLEDAEEAEAAVSRTVNDFSNKEHSKESHNALAVAKFVKAFDKAKSSVVAKFNTKTLKTKEQVVAEVRNSVQTLLSEVGSISESYYRGTASEEGQPELYEMIATAFEKSIALNETDQEAYLMAVQEDYITYDIINYSNDSVATMKASFVVTDSEVEIDFANATEFATKEDIESMAKEKETVVASEEVVEEVVAVEAGLETEVAEEVVEASKEEEKEKDNDEEKAKASEYEATIAGLQSQLAEANEKVAQLEARFADIEADKVVANRMAELLGAGITFSDTRLAKEQAKLRGMDEEAYADYKELLMEVAGNKAEATEAKAEEVEASEEEAEASYEEEEASVEEEIVVEGAKASELNLETPPVTSKRPFGHLTSR
jgi:hypothetical protein